MIAPASEPVHVRRRYRGQTLIMETQFETDDGTVTLIDFMPLRGEAPDIVRLVRGDAGRVAMRMELIIRFGFGAHIPWVRRIDDCTMLAVCGPDMVVLRTPVKARGLDMTTVAEFEVDEGVIVPFVMTYEASHRPIPDPIDWREALEGTEAFWCEWVGACRYRGEHREAVVRSLVALKALTYSPTGGIVAAATTSLPEKLRGDRNWDYRFCWLRDATFTLLALMNSGYYEEATAWHHWLLRAVAGSPADLQIMYGITGLRRLTEWQADWLPGYERASPVRIGNAAYDQLQLDVYGELLDVFHQSRMADLELDGSSWALECELLKHLSKIWERPDCGIWERRNRDRHYVSSKVLAWVAFDRGIKSAERFGFEAPVSHWRERREEIHRDVCERGFDPAQNAFVEAYGSPLLDASVLLLPAVGFLPATDPRMLGTVVAIERHLMHDGFVLRHDPRERGVNEGAFLACSLWLADVYVLCGRIDDARILFDRVVGVANDLGLLSEEYDSDAQRLTGNFPQALTHIALINTAHNISAAQKPAVQRAC